MANEKINQYIEKCLELGKTEEEIKGNLLSVGWKEEDVENSFSFVRDKKQENEAPFPSQEEKGGLEELSYRENLEEIQDNQNLEGDLNSKINNILKEEGDGGIKNDYEKSFSEKETALEEEDDSSDQKQRIKKKTISLIGLIILLGIIFTFLLIDPFSWFANPEPREENINQENVSELPEGSEIDNNPIYENKWFCGQEIIDERDGKFYPTVLIGSQCWTAKNMDYFTQNSWCYDDSELNCSLHGRLYSWESSLVSCPVGWTLPTDDQFKEMETYLGMPQNQLDKNNFRGEIGSTLSYDVLNGNNQSGFNALLSGIRTNNGEYKYINEYANFWLIDNESTKSSTRSLHSKKSSIYRDFHPVEYGYSVRCLKLEEINEFQADDLEYINENTVDHYHEEIDNQEVILNDF